MCVGQNSWCKDLTFIDDLALLLEKLDKPRRHLIFVCKSTQLGFLSATPLASIDFWKDLKTRTPNRAICRLGSP